MAGKNKAYIKILAGQYKDEEIYIQFNPKEYSLEKTNEFEDKPLLTLQAVKSSFQKSTEGDFTVEFLFDSTDTGESVLERIEPLKKITTIDKDLHSPPPCLFIWKDAIYKGVVTKVIKKFTYFFSDGTPARARVTLTFKSYKTKEEIESETIKNSADISKRRVIKEGDNLWLIAFQEYGDVSYWRYIASFNGIFDPLSVEPGTEIILPKREE